jgi:hypothetical protein
MEFFIKKNATLPVLKMLIIKDGRSDFGSVYNNIPLTGITFSITEVSTGIPKIISAPCEVIQETTTDGEILNYVTFQFTTRDTQKEGKYKGSFSIINSQGTLILPLTEDVYIMIGDSFISSETCCEQQTNNTPCIDCPQPTPTPSPIPPQPGELAIGKMYQGGMIAYLDGTGEHGFVVNVSLEVSPLMNTGRWGRTGEFLNVTGTSIGLATYNTDIIAANISGVINAAVYFITTGADVWDAYNGYTDWKLPTLDEMIQIYSVNNFIRRFGERWTSSEIDSNNAYCFNMYDGTYGPKVKSDFAYFLAIRYF